MFRTYVVGDNSLVKRLDNHTTPWVDLTSNLFPNLRMNSILDVMAKPGFSDSVVAVGMTGSVPSNSKGIIVSNNAGVLWAPPSGNYQSVWNNAFTWREVWYIDANNVVVVGDQGRVAYSNNQANSFNLVGQVLDNSSNPVDLYSVHFITSNIGVVGGVNGEVYYTLDAGSNWGALPGSIGIINDPIVGIHISQDQQTIVAVTNNNIWRSTNAGATFTAVYTCSGLISNSLLHLTWINDTTLWATGTASLRLKTTNAGATWTTQNAPAAFGEWHYGAQMYTADDGYVTGTGAGIGGPVYSTSDSMITLIQSDNPYYLPRAVWTEETSSVTCTVLESCADGSTISISQDLISLIGTSIYVSQPDSIKGCYTIIDGSCDPVIITPSPFIYETIADCDVCRIPCFILTNCEDPTDIIYSNEDLTNEIGNVIQIQGSPKCWTVSAGSEEGCDCIQATVKTASFSRCDLCLPKPVKKTKFYVEPGYTPIVCTEEREILVNCAFAEAYYSDMLSRRYGINICCEYDLLESFLAKEKLLMLQLTDNINCGTNTSNCGCTSSCTGNCTPGCTGCASGCTGCSSC
jgi:photosystem II stability/assembly factor-like uncharacterized protein